MSFSKGNAKLDASTLTFSLPSGYTCPYACECLAKVNRVTGKVTDGKKQKYRCFSASMEAAFSSVRKSRWNNLQLVKDHLKKGDLPEIILQSIPEETPAVRIHIGGDFFNQDYFDAWIKVSQKRPQTIFYAYTKSIPFWKARFGSIPENFRLTASEGGKADEIIKELNLPTTIVVNHPDEAKKEGLEIDHDDSHPKDENRQKFALLIHGTQPKGTPAAKAINLLRKLKIPFGYPRAA